MRYRNTQASHRGPAGFTLVELMMVITIIALLAAIMLPTLDAARTGARNTAINSLIMSISAGLETFRGDFKGVYPPSIWRTNGAFDTPDPGGDPYGVGGPPYEAYGAQTLVWGLAGADLLGTPGFGVDPDRTPQLSLDRDPPPGVQGLYEVSGGAPAFPRYGPYINISKTKIKTPVQDEDDLTFPLAGGIDYQGYAGAPVIVDDYKRPVLYFAPHSNHFKPAGTPAEYQHFDNYGLRDRVGNDAPTFWTVDGFASYIEDPRVGRLSGGIAHGPYNPQGYLLISAGRDLHYGTGDDITNFPLNVLPPP